MPPMGYRQFLSVVLDRLEHDASPGVMPWESTLRLSMLQIHFGNPRVHYELWLQAKAGRAELDCISRMTRRSMPAGALGSRSASSSCATASVRNSSLRIGLRAGNGFT